MSHFDWVPLARAVLVGFSWLASRTATPIDDQVAKLFESQLDNPAFVDFINSLLPHGSDEAVMSAASARNHDALRADLERAGLDWLTFVKMLPAIVALVKALIGK